MSNILVAPLHWGLGHATRCVPVIRHLLAGGHRVFLASDGDAGSLLQQEFAHLPYFELPSYDVHYPSHMPMWFWLKELPRIRKVISAEHRLLDQLVVSNDIDIIISDNRYGMYHSKTKNILISHQLTIPNAAWGYALVNQQLGRLIHHFDECWVPDYEGDTNLSGMMSARQLKIPKYFIGPLSRFAKTKAERKYEICVVLSGPEPYKTQLQQKLEQLLSGSGLRVAWVMGRPKRHKVIGEHRFGHLSSSALSALIQSCAASISRSGYSSIMDYHALQSKAIIIPTPLQPEQSYLAERHKHKSQFYVPKPDLTDLLQGFDNLLKATVKEAGQPSENRFPLC